MPWSLQKTPSLQPRRYSWVVRGVGRRETGREGEKDGLVEGKGGARQGAHLRSSSIHAYMNIGNGYLLRVGIAFKDLLCDGRPEGISAQLFRARAEREMERNGIGVCTRWLEEEGEGEEGREERKEKGRLAGCLGLGHLINDPKGSECDANVVFKASRLTADSAPPSLPPSLLPYLPTLSASGNNRMERVVVAVVALEGIEGGRDGKELFVSYGQDPTSVGYV